MIISEFETVKDIFDDGVVAFDFNTPPIKIAFRGNRIVSIDFIGGVYNELVIPEIDTIYGKILLSYLDGIQTFFIVLKNKTIFSIDYLPITTLQNIIINYETIREFDSFKLIKSFSDL